MSSLSTCPGSFERFCSEHITLWRNTILDWVEVGGPAVLLVHYEDFLSNKLATIRRVLSHLQADM